MNNVHPLFRAAVAPFSPAQVVKVAPTMRPFAVTFWIAGKQHELNVLAFTSCDAICKAIDIYFDGDEPMPADGLEIVAHPLNLLPAA